MTIIDDKSEHCIPFLLKHLETHRKEHGSTGRPFFLGLNGVQGAGKTTLVKALHETLQSSPHNLQLAVLSLDDFYLTHSDQLQLAKSHPSNPLVQHRGQPSTHDLPLLESTLNSLHDRKPTSLPSYDKSLFSGAGDRAPQETWTQITSPLDIVVLEGWCVGFQALPASTLHQKWSNARENCSEEGPGVLGRLNYEDVEFVNTALEGYGKVWKMFDAFVHIDAAQPEWVYDWRLEAEVKMRESKGVENAMSDEKVKEFVDGYYPAYELYTETLRKGIFDGQEGKQLRLVIGKDRKVQDVFVL